MVRKGTQNLARTWQDNNFEIERLFDRAATLEAGEGGDGWGRTVDV